MLPAVCKVQAGSGNEVGPWRKIPAGRSRAWAQLLCQAYSSSPCSAQEDSAKIAWVVLITDFFYFFFMAQCRPFFPQSNPLTLRPGFSNYCFSIFPTGEGVAYRSAAFRTTQTFSLLHTCHSSFLFCLLRFFCISLLKVTHFSLSQVVLWCHTLGIAVLCPYPLFCSHLALASISLLSSPNQYNHLAPGSYSSFSETHQVRFILGQNYLF